MEGIRGVQTIYNVLHRKSSKFVNSQGTRSSRNWRSIRLARYRGGGGGGGGGWVWLSRYQQTSDMPWVKNGRLSSSWLEKVRLSPPRCLSGGTHRTAISGLGVTVSVSTNIRHALRVKNGRLSSSWLEKVRLSPPRCLSGGTHRTASATPYATSAWHAAGRWRWGWVWLSRYQQTSDMPWVKNGRLSSSWLEKAWVRRDAFLAVLTVLLVLHPTLRPLGMPLVGDGGAGCDCLGINKHQTCPELKTVGCLALDLRRWGWVRRDAFLAVLTVLLSRGWVWLSRYQQTSDMPWVKNGRLSSSWLEKVRLSPPRCLSGGTHRTASATPYATSAWHAAGRWRWGWVWLSRYQQTSDMPWVKNGRLSSSWLEKVRLSPPRCLSGGTHRTASATPYATSAWHAAGRWRWGWVWLSRYQQTSDMPWVKNGRLSSSWLEKVRLSPPRCLSGGTHRTASATPYATSAWHAAGRWRWGWVWLSRYQQTSDMPWVKNGRLSSPWLEKVRLSPPRCLSGGTHRTASATPYATSAWHAAGRWRWGWVWLSRYQRTSDMPWVKNGRLSSSWLEKVRLSPPRCLSGGTHRTASATPYATSAWHAAGRWFDSRIRHVSLLVLLLLVLGLGVRTGCQH